MKKEKFIDKTPILDRTLMGHTCTCRLLTANNEHHEHQDQGVRSQGVDGMHNERGLI